MARRYPEFHAPAFDSPQGRVHIGIPGNWTEALRTAWRATDPAERDWQLAQLLSLAGQVLATSACQHADYERNLAVSVLLEAIRLGDGLAICANPDCSAPLFIRSRKNQSVCSADCRDAMQRKWQRDWWAKHGRNWRKGSKTRKRRQSRRKTS